MPKPSEMQAVDPKVRAKLDELDQRQAATQADSTAPDVATLKNDFNALLAKLRTANLLKP